MAGEVENSQMNEKSIPHTVSGINLSRLREKVKFYIEKHQYESALFWADKVVSLSNGNPDDVYWYAQTLYLTGQYHRASQLLRSRKLDKNNSACRYLAAKCHFECKEWQTALNILDMVENNSFLPSFTKHNLTDSLYDQSQKEVVEQSYNLSKSGTCVLERELLDTLPFAVQCPVEEVELIRYLYENRIKKYDKPKEHRVPGSLSCLKTNKDIVVNVAERHYYNCDFRECHKITTKVMSDDPYNTQCLPIHIAVLVELKKAKDLFYLSHKLVDLYPNDPVSWFAVGCYYLLTEKSEPARRYLSKATTLDRVYGPAWLAFGHSFAAENEHDQAMVAYFTASQLMKGCHLPLLYIGLEHGLTNNFKLAERFFSQALSIAPEDPFVLHEMGVIAFKSQEWSTAERYFMDALRILENIGQEVIVEKWEPLLNNLGHTYRKLRNYEKSLEYHKRAGILSPQNPSTYSAIGYTYVLKGDNLMAVDYFHKALGIRRDDQFSTTMLSSVIETLMSEMDPCEGASEDFPAFPTPGKLEFSHSSSQELSDLDINPEDNSSMAIEEVDMDD
ncbi:cell division cycle protein 16 homolog [Saccostrea cucullata]|uniref:cell division cycle protein 16 homolog n=1 Tax=Saccostrea cuccullata TaxID=36930 RepID=UPI002ED6AD01